MTATTTSALEFVSPLPGLGPNTSFTLDRIDGAEGLYALRSVVDGLRLFLLDPTADAWDYRPPLTAGTRAQVDAADESEVRLFVVANPADDGVYVNLRAPIFVHRDTGRAVQVILDDQNYPIRGRLGHRIAR